MTGTAPAGTPNPGAPAAAPVTPPADPNAQPTTTPTDPPATTPADPAVDPLKVTPPATPTEPEPLLQFDAITTEWQEKGELSDDTLKAIEAKGIPRAYVDVYMAGLQAIQQQATNQVYSVTGGEDRYKAMMGWASANLSAAEIEAYNDAMSSNDASRNLAVQGLYAKFQANAGTEGVTVQGSTTSTAPAYQNWDEVKTAMKDKRYGKDRSYTAEVQNKLKNSKL